MVKENPMTRNMAYIVGVIFSAGVLVGNASLTTIRSVRNSNDISILKLDKAADGVRMETLVDDVRYIKEYIMNWEPDDGQAAKEEEKEDKEET